MTHTYTTVANRLWLTSIFLVFLLATNSSVADALTQSRLAGKTIGVGYAINTASGSSDSGDKNVTVTVFQQVFVEPSSLSLQGGSGETPTTTFTITSGTPPFSLVSANEEGRGSFSNTSPGLNETVTYGFRIPGGATNQQQFTDIITITDYQGDTTTLMAITTAAVAITQNDIDGAMEAIAQTAPQLAVAGAISTLCPSGTAEPRLQEDCNVVVGAALSNDIVEQAEASVALGQVTADQASAPVSASSTSIRGQNLNVATRISALRGGAVGFSTSGLTINLNGQALPAGQLAEALMHSTGGAAGSDTAMDFGRLGIFINGSLSRGDKDRTANVDGFDFDAVSITVGADYRFTDNLLAGVALGYTSNDTDLDADGGNLDADSYSLSLYASYYQDSGLYLDGIFNYGQSDYDQRRNIRYQIGTVNVDQTALSDFDGSQWSLSVGGGYTMTRGAVSFGPTARLEYMDTSIDGFQEQMTNPNQAGGGWATRINSQDADSLTAQIGGDIAYAMSTSWGVLLPNANIEWVHEFKDDSGNVVGHFVQDTSQTQFSLPTDSLDSNYFNLRLGLSAQFAEGRSAYIYYRKLLGYSDLDVDTVAAGFRLEF